MVSQTPQFLKNTFDIKKAFIWRRKNTKEDREKFCPHIFTKKNISALIIYFCYSSALYVPLKASSGPLGNGWSDALARDEKLL